MTTLTCGDCGAAMVLKRSKHGLFYSCSRYLDCRGTHGAHADGRPLGVPADAVTRQARIEAHAIFDEWWRTNRVPRDSAYRHLSCALGIPEAHIGSMSADECQAVMRIVAQWRRQAPRRKRP